MALQFDGDGIVTIPAWAAAGEFTISGTCTYSADGEVVIGDVTDVKDGVLLTATGLQMRINNLTRDVAVAGVTVGTVMEYSIVRNASNQLVFTVNEVAASTLTNTSEFNVTHLGTRTNNQATGRYSGVMSGQVLLSQTGDDRAYELDTSTGLELTDSGNAQHGTLSGFTSGGWVTGGNTAPVVSAGANQSADGNVLVQLAGTATDADPGDTLVNTWSHVSGPGGVFSDPNDLNATWLTDNTTGTTVLRLSSYDGTTTVTSQMTITVTAVVVSGVAGLLFDTAGAVVLPDWLADDDLDVTLVQAFKENRVLLGRIDATGGSRIDYIQYGTEADKKVKINISGILKTFVFDTLVEGDRPLIRLTRAAGNSVLHIRVSLGTQMFYDKISNGAALMFNRVGEYFNPSASIRYNGTMTGTLSMLKTGDNRRYNFDGTGTTLIDELGGQHGTLTNFTTGGYVNQKALRLAMPTLLQHREPDGTTDLVIAGEIDNPAETEAVYYSLDQGATWTLLETTSASATTFSTAVTITGTTELWVRLDSDQTLIAREYEVGAALIVYTLGAQSNEDGAGENNQVMDALDPGAPVPMMIRVDEGGDYMLHTLADPSTSYILFDTPSGNGSQWPAIAELFANRGIKMVLYKPAVGGTGIDQWSKDYVGGLTPYWQGPGDIPALLAAMGQPNFNIAYRGEYEIARVVSESMDYDYIVERYDNFTNDIFADFGCKSVWTIPTSVATTNQLTFASALDFVIANNEHALSGGNMQDVLLLQDQGPGTLDPDSVGDQIHVTTDAQIELVAQARYDAIVAVEKILGIVPANINPSVNAGTDQVDIAPGATVTFASTSSDPDGEIASIVWTQPGGDAVELSDINAENPSFTAPITQATQVLTFRKTVTDSDAGVSYDEVDITVLGDTTAPVIILSDDGPFEIFEGQTFTPPTAIATDDTDPDTAVTPTGSVDSNTPGTYTMDFNRTDTAGNVAITKTITIEVIALTAQARAVSLAQYVCDTAYIVAKNGAGNLTQLSFALLEEVADVELTGGLFDFDANNVTLARIRCAGREIDSAAAAASFSGTTLTVQGGALGIDCGKHQLDIAVKLSSSDDWVQLVGPGMSSQIEIIFTC